MSESIYLIYKFTSPSGKSYIGQTCNITRRLYEHKRAASPQAFHSAIRKYGWDNFTYEILAAKLSLEESNILEEKFIKEHNTLVPCGYNLLMGGLNYGRTDETRKKMSLAQLGKFRLPLTEDAKRHLSEINKGKKLSEVTKQKISTNSARRGKPSHTRGKPAYNRGKSPSTETRKKISAALAGKARSPRSEETKQKLSTLKKGQKRLIDPITGKISYYHPVAELKDD